MNSTILALRLLGGGILCSIALTANAQDPTPLLTRPVNVLIGVINSNASLHETTEACRELAVVGNKDAVAALATLLADEKRSHLARYALEPLPEPSVDTAFRTAVGTTHGRTLAGIIDSIGVRQDAEAAPLLTKLLHDPDSDVVEAAARSLGNIATPVAVAGLRTALAPAIGRIRIALNEGLLRCAETLRKRGDKKDAGAIYDQLRASSSPSHVQVAAFRGAILIRGAAGLPLLRESLRHSDFAVFTAGIRTTYEMEGVEVTRVLAKESLRTVETDRKVLIIQALGKRADSVSIEALATAASSKEPPVSLAAVRCLGETGIPAAAPHLAAWVTSEDSAKAQAAMAGLASLQGDSVDNLIYSMLKDPAPARRVAAIELIGRRKDRARISDLFKASADAASPVRIAALNGIGELGGASDLPALLRVLTGLTDPLELEAAEQTLSGIAVRADRPGAVVAIVAETIPKAAPSQKGALVRVMGSLGGESALRVVRSALDEPSPEVHAAAIRTLGAWKTADAAPILLTLATNAPDATDRTLSLHNYLGLASSSDIPANERLQLCRNATNATSTPESKKLLLAALGGIDSIEVVTLIAPFLKDASVHEEAGAALLTVAERLQKAKTPVPAELWTPALELVVSGSRDNSVRERAASVLRQVQK